VRPDLPIRRRRRPGPGPGRIDDDVGPVGATGCDYRPGIALLVKRCYLPVDGDSAAGLSDTTEKPMVKRGDVEFLGTAIEKDRFDDPFSSERMARLEERSVSDLHPDGLVPDLFVSRCDGLFLSGGTDQKEIDVPPQRCV